MDTWVHSKFISFQKIKQCAEKSGYFCLETYLVLLFYFCLIKKSLFENLKMTNTFSSLFWMCKNLWDMRCCQCYFVFILNLIEIDTANFLQESHRQLLNIEIRSVKNCWKQKVPSYTCSIPTLIYFIISLGRWSDSDLNIPPYLLDDSFICYNYYFILYSTFEVDF